MGRIERNAERVVEGGFGDVEIGGALDALLVDHGQVHADGEDVGIGGHAGSADGFGAFEIGLGGAEGLCGGLEAGGGEDRVVVGARDGREDRHADAALVLGGHLARELGGVDAGAGLAGVIDHLVKRELGLEVVEGGGSIELPFLCKPCCPGWTFATKAKPIQCR